MHHVVASGYSQGFYAFSLDQATAKVNGEVTKHGDQEGSQATNLTFTAYDAAGGNLYGVHEVGEFDGNAGTGAVSRWKVDKETRALEKKEVSR